MVLGTNENTFNEKNPNGNLSCDVSENLDVLNHNNHIVQNVCVSKDYSVDREPDEDRLTDLNIMFTNIKVVNMDEEKKRITVEITAVSVWEDNRILILQAKDHRAVRLPSISKGDVTPVIWNPFFTATISHFRKIRYVYDPTKIQMSLIPPELATGLLQTNFNSANTLLVASRIDWSVTVSCDFDFSRFPFDRNDCLLGISLFGL